MCRQQGKQPCFGACSKAWQRTRTKARLEGPEQPYVQRRVVGCSVWHAVSERRRLLGSHGDYVPLTVSDSPLPSRFLSSSGRYDPLDQNMR